MPQRVARTVPHSSKIELPGWARNFAPLVLPRDDKACIDFVLDLAESNVAHNTGGPFAAMLVEDGAARILSIGVNLVPVTDNPILHAETVALSLGAPLAEQGAPLTLYVSCEPCIMCLGAIHWSNVRRVVYAAHKEDAESAGFNEGEGAVELKAAMRDRGIEFQAGPMRERAAHILQAYRRSGGPIYGPETN